MLHNKYCQDIKLKKNNFLKRGNFFKKHILETQAGFKTEFLGILESLYQMSLEELKKREAERLNIESGIEEAKREVDDDCVGIIEVFTETKEEVFEKLTEMADQFLDLDPEAITDSQINSVETLRADYRLQVKLVWDTLMGQELMLVNSIEAMIEEYEARLGRMTDGFLEIAGTELQQARDTETMYFQHLLDQAEGVSGIDHDLVLDTVALCHDGHQAVLDRQQENLRQTVVTWREEHFRCLRDAEFDRSRSRVLEICHFTDTLRQELEDLEVLPNHGLDGDDGVD